MGANKKTSGLICPKHFRGEDLLRLPTSKGNNNVQLIRGAIPIADSNEKVNMGEMYQMSEIESREPSSPSHTHPHDMDMTESHQQQCKQCILKESLILSYERRIESLQHDLKSVQNSLRYYKDSKAKMKSMISQMEKDNSINSELIRELEVGFITLTDRDYANLNQTSIFRERRILRFQNHFRQVSSTYRFFTRR